MDSLGPLLQGWRLETMTDNNGYRHHKLQSGPECWSEVNQLGEGKFGIVFQELCLSGRSKNSMRAVKHVFKSRIFSETRRELDALVTFSNSEFPEYRKYFVQFLGWFDDARHLYIVMEFFEHGDLHNNMKNCGTIPETEAASITAQVAQALQYMHEKDFIHRDIKPSNILVSRPGPYWHVKVADFGGAKNIDGSIPRTYAGTHGYMAPEVWSSSPYTPAVDIWSLGAVAYYIRTGFPPSTNPSDLNKYARDQNRHFSIQPLRNSGAFCTDFVMRAMAEVPEQRLTIEQVLAHDWLQIDYMQLVVSQRGEPTMNAKDEQTTSTIPAYNTWSSDRQSQPRLPSTSIMDPRHTPEPSKVSSWRPGTQALGKFAERGMENLTGSSTYREQHGYGQENKSEKKVGSIKRKPVGRNNPETIVARSNTMGIHGKHSDAKEIGPKDSHLSQTPSKSADFTSIAQQFVNFYYQTFDIDRNGLLPLYRDRSMLTFETISFLGAQSIVKKLNGLPFQKFQHQVKTLDPQSTHGNAIMVLVTGALLVDKEQVPMNFTQCFELMPENDGSYYVLNDIFRLVMG